MKKLVKLALAAVCSSVLFISCGGSGANGKKQLIPVEIWYSAYSSNADPFPSESVLYQRVEDELGIKLKLVPLPVDKNEQNEKVLLEGRRNRLPDLFYCNRDVLVQLLRMNQVSRVDKMYDLMPKRTSRMYDDNARKSSMFDGLSYGLSQSGSIDRNEGVLIRKDWLDKLGLQIPITTDEFMTVMNAFTYNDPDGNGKDDTYGFGAYLEIKANEEGLGNRFAPFLGAFGVEGTFNISKKNAGLNIHKDSYYDALEYIRTMISSKVIDPNWIAYGKDDFRAAWKEGRFGIMREQNAAFALESNYKPFDEKFPEGEWILINPPVGPKGESSVGVYATGYRTYAISRRAGELGKLPAIARLLEWMSTDGYNLICYGIEGENFLLDENGKVTTKGLPDPNLAYTKKNVAPLLQLRNLVFYNSDDELQARYPTWYTKNGKEMSALTLLRDMQRKTWTMTAGVPGAEKDLKVFYEQGVLDFVTGRRNLTFSNWQDWLKEFDRRGGIKWEKDALEYCEENNILLDNNKAW